MEKNKKYTYHCQNNPEHGDSWVEVKGKRLCRACYNLHNEGKTFFAVNHAAGVRLGYGNMDRPK
jgi:hypothetical protein